MNNAKLLPRILALLLIPALIPPSPALALRPAAAPQSGVEEELAARFDQPPSLTNAGVEEWGEDTWNRLYELSALGNVSLTGAFENVLEFYIFPPSAGQIEQRWEALRSAIPQEDSPLTEAVRAFQQRKIVPVLMPRVSLLHDRDRKEGVLLVGDDRRFQLVVALVKDSQRWELLADKQPIGFETDGKLVAGWDPLTETEELSVPFDPPSKNKNLMPAPVTRRFVPIQRVVWLTPWNLKDTSEQAFREAIFKKDLFQNIPESFFKALFSSPRTVVPVPTHAPVRWYRSQVASLVTAAGAEEDEKVRKQLNLLTSPDANVRRAATSALEKMDWDRVGTEVKEIAVQSLTSYLAPIETDIVVRWNAASALEKMAWSGVSTEVEGTAIQGLVGRLDSTENEDVRRAASSALKRMDWSGVSTQVKETVIQALAGHLAPAEVNVGVRQNAVLVLERMDWSGMSTQVKETAIQSLAGRLAPAETDSGVRHYAARALGIMDWNAVNVKVKETAIRALTSRLAPAETNVDVRSYAARTLGIMDWSGVSVRVQETAIQGLISRLAPDDTSPYYIHLHRDAAQALGAFAWSRAADPVLGILRETLVDRIVDFPSPGKVESEAILSVLAHLVAVGDPSSWITPYFLMRMLALDLNARNSVALRSARAILFAGHADQDWFQLRTWLPQGVTAVNDINFPEEFRRENALLLLEVLRRGFWSDPDWSLPEGWNSATLKELTESTSARSEAGLLSWAAGDRVAESITGDELQMHSIHAGTPITLAPPGLWEGGDKIPSDAELQEEDSPLANRSLASVPLGALLGLLPGEEPGEDWIRQFPGQLSQAFPAGTRFLLLRRHPDHLILFIHLPKGSFVPAQAGMEEGVGGWLQSLPIFSERPAGGVIKQLLETVGQTDEKPVTVQFKGDIFPAQARLQKVEWLRMLQAPRLPQEFTLYIQMDVLPLPQRAALIEWLGVKVQVLSDEISEDRRQEIFGQIQRKQPGEPGKTPPEALLLLNRKTFEQFDEALVGQDRSRIPAVIVGVREGALAGVNFSAVASYLLGLLKKATDIGQMVTDRLEDSFSAESERATWFLRSSA